MNLKGSMPSEESGIQLLDGAVDGLAAWREESHAVSASYQRWMSATRQARERAYDAYVAALDREERAALAYRLLVERGQMTYRSAAR